MVERELPTKFDLVKNLKIKILKKKKRKDLEIWWREGATYKIWPESMQRFLRNQSLQTTGRLRHDSSSADKVKQS